MTAQTETRIHTAADAATLADTLNAACEDGKRVLVNDRELWNRFTKRPAASWGTGSVSFTTRANSGHTERTCWIKPGQTVTVTVTER